MVKMDWEERRAALDEYLADMDYDRRKLWHDRGECEPDECEFCMEQKNTNEMRAALFVLLRAALIEARRWIGDGPCSDGFSREHWKPDYAAMVDLVDAALAVSKNEELQGEIKCESKK
jgi:hypothetical protein